MVVAYGNVSEWDRINYASFDVGDDTKYSSGMTIGAGIVL